MKWLNEEEENYIRNKLPVLIKSSLSESFSETASNIMGEIGHRVLARLHQLNAGTAQNDVQTARRLQSEILMHHYANHLGIKSAHLSTIINDYEKIAPVKPTPVLSGMMPNPNYAIEKREYDNKLIRYNERQRILAQIKGLQQSNPVLGGLARKLGNEEIMSRRAVRWADPTVIKTNLRRPLPGGGSEMVPKRYLTSQIHLLKAEALRRKRKRKP